MATMYRSGRGGLKTDTRRCQELLEAASEQGRMESTFKLATWDLPSVSESDKAKWLVVSAKQGHHLASRSIHRALGLERTRFHVNHTWIGDVRLDNELLPFHDSDVADGLIIFLRDTGVYGPPQWLESEPADLEQVCRVVVQRANMSYLHFVTLASFKFMKF